MNTITTIQETNAATVLLLLPLQVNHETWMNEEAGLGRYPNFILVHRGRAS